MGLPWIIGGALLGVGLIGEWLLSPHKSSTARPDSMPQMNSAMRGSPIYVTFGANRVYPQVTWTKNFKAVRQQSSGKGGGKGGGSGGMGSMKGGGSAGQQYEYYWDMIFNFGMMDQASVITQGWIGGDPIDDTTIQNILAGFIPSGKTDHGDGFFALWQDLIDFMKSKANAVNTNGTATMKFTSSFYAAGYNTGDPGLETWSYFQSQESVACQFPSTAWIGFQQLDLGPSPAIPQISFEFVPQIFNISSGDGFISRCGAGSDGNQGFRYTGHGLLRDDDSHAYALDEHHGAGGTSGRAIITNIVTSSQFKISQTDFATLTSDVNWFNTIPVPDTPYFYMLTSNPESGHSAFYITAYLFKVNTDGTASYTGKNVPYHYLDDFFEIGSDNIRAIQRSGDGRLMVIYIGSFSAHYETRVQMLPDPYALINNIDNYTATISAPISLPFHDASDFECNVGFCGSTRSAPYAQAGIVTGASSQENWACFYVGIGEINFHLAHSPGDLGYVKYIGDLVSTYPHGMMIMAKITCDGSGGLSYSDVGVNNDYFTNETGDPLVPYVDRQKDFDGNPTGDDSDDWFTPSGNGFVLVFRPYSTDHFTFRYDFLRNDGNGATRDDSHRLSITLTADEIGSSPTIPYVISPTISSTGAIFASVDYSGGGGNAGTVQVEIANTSVDVTPAYIIYRILTSPIFGFQTEALFGYQITADRIDQASYQRAVEWCVSQGIYVSVTYTNQDNLLNILNELVGLYGGFLTDPGGIIQFGVVTGSDEPVRVIDNNHLVADKGTPPVKVTKAALEDGFNRIQFNYLDRALNYNQNQVQVDDEVDQDINTIRPKTYDARFVMNGSVAMTIATRALWANLYGKDTYDLVLGWKDADLSQGDLITLVDSFEDTLKYGVRARITKWNMTKRGRFECQAVREFPYIITASVNYTQTSTTDGGWGTLVQSVMPMTNQTAYELPQEFQQSKAYTYFGYQQASLIMGAQLYLSADGGNFVLTQDVQPYILSGVFNEELPARPRGWVEHDVDFWLFPTADFSTASPTFVQTYDMDNVSEALRAQGAGTFIVGSEAIAFEELTLLGQNHYKAARAWRGWGGTPITDHSSGEWFHHHAAGIFQHEIAPSDIGNKIWYKIVPYNFAGQLYDIASIDARTYMIRGDYWLPRAQPNVRLYVESALAWSASVPVTGPYIGITSGGCDLTLGWENAAQAEGYGAGGYGANKYGHFKDDGSTDGWRIDVASSNGHFVSSFLVNSPSFTYTLAQNIADFGAFAHDLVLKTTPYNVKGDGPTSDIRSISMNW